MWIAVLQAIASLPKIFSYLVQFSGWLSGQVELIQKKQALEKLKKSIDQSKDSKDTSGLDGVFKGGNKK